jgi:putative PIN family toxin of toxin-antitoxin system
MIVVFDTNVLVSAFEFPRGRASLILTLINTGRDTLFISQPIVDELLRVLTLKFRRNETDLQPITAWLAQFAQLIEPNANLHILADEPDNRILECAVAANANVIVTGDREMLALERIGRTRIVSLASYLDVDNSLINS